jgi:hypothetical protein
MPADRVKIDKIQSGCIVRPIDRPADLLHKLQHVYRLANAAAALPADQQSGPQYHALYNEGPLLFDENVIDPQTGVSHSQLGGLQLTEQRLSATLAALHQVGFEVVE